MVFTLSLLTRGADFSLRRLQPASARHLAWRFVRQAILPVRMGLRPMKGDENVGEVQLSCSFFDARTGGRVADRVNRKSEAFDRAGGLSGRRFRYATNFSGFAAGCLRTRSRRK